MKYVLSVVLVILLCSLAHAGSRHEVKCADGKCGFNTSIGIGGGFVFKEAPGYCPKCQKCVAVTWKREGKAPAPLAEFWDSQTGELRQVYACPHCGGPYVVINSIEEMKFCPRCKEPTLQSKRTVMYD